MTDLIARLEAATVSDEDYSCTADLVAYLRGWSDEGHQTAAARLEAYESILSASLRAREGV